MYRDTQHVHSTAEGNHKVSNAARWLTVTALLLTGKVWADEEIAELDPNANLVIRVLHELWRCLHDLWDLVTNLPCV